MRKKKTSSKNPRHAQAQPLKEGFHQMLESFGLKDKYLQSKIQQTWIQVMGEPIAKRTESLRFEKRRLTIKVNSAPLKKELLLSKDKILGLFNKEFGEGTVLEVDIR